MKNFTFTLFAISFTGATYFLCIEKNICAGTYFSLLCILNLMSLFKQIKP